MALAHNELQALRELKQMLELRYQVRDLRVYGSKARGTDTEGSDIDVMIVLDHEAPGVMSEIDDMLFEINLRHDCLISAIVYFQRELVEGPLSESPLYKNAVREGIAL